MTALVSQHRAGMGAVGTLIGTAWTTLAPLAISIYLIAYNHNRQSRIHTR